MEKDDNPGVAPLDEDNAEQPPVQPGPPGMTLNRGAAVLSGLLATVLVIGWAYLPGLGAAFHFDTPPNLQGLDRLRHFEDMFRFLVTGQAGPTGRPLALLTFLPQAEHWPDDPVPFLQVNIVIHLINSVLLAWVLFLVAREHSGNVHKSAWVAVLGAALWAASPLLVSTSLSVIQRMTSLSALFVFAGIAGHLHLRRLGESRPRIGLVLLSGNLALFTVLAGLSKENGLLLPVLILVIEACLLPNPRRITPGIWKLWRTIFLVVPLLAIVAYLASRIGYSDQVLMRRDFTAWERLITQAGILWEYLFHAFVPAMHRLGPFHEHYPVARSLFEPATLLAVVAWAGVVSAAIGLRKRLPVFTFAVAWYLTAHLLESTVIPLELYFEHRNYVALVGPMFAIAYGLIRAPESLRRLLLAGGVLFLLLCVFVLHTTTSLWGNRDLAGQFWHENNPESTRATMYYGQELVARGDITGFLFLMDHAAEEIEEPEFALLQGKHARCTFNYGGYEPEELAMIKANLPDAPLTRSLPNQLQSMYETRQQIDCAHYTIEDVYEMAEILVDDNPRYFGGRFAYYPLRLLMGQIRRDQGDRPGAIKHYEAASKEAHDIDSIWALLNLYTEVGEYERACRHFTRLSASPPGHFFQRRIWLGQLEQINEHLEADAGVDSCEELL